MQNLLKIWKLTTFWLYFFQNLWSQFLCLLTQSATGLFIYPVKASENRWFSDIFRRYRKTSSMKWVSGNFDYSSKKLWPEQTSPTFHPTFFLHLWLNVGWKITCFKWRIFWFAHLHPTFHPTLERSFIHKFKFKINWKWRKKFGYHQY